jgi:hypothetical protein
VAIERIAGEPALLGVRAEQTCAKRKGDDMFHGWGPLVKDHTNLAGKARRMPVRSRQL